MSIFNILASFCLATVVNSYIFPTYKNSRIVHRVKHSIIVSFGLFFITFASIQYKLNALSMSLFILSVLCNLLIDKQVSESTYSRDFLEFMRMITNLIIIVLCEVCRFASVI